jgi:lysozyme
MKTSADGLALIEQFESLRLESYQDGAGIWTIGYGHTEGVGAGQCCTEEQADTWMAEDVGHAESAVNSLVKVPLSQNQFDALVSFAFNLGAGNLKSSTMLRLLNAGTYQLAGNEFPKWDKVASRDSAGLLRRRVAEQELFTREA